VFELYIPGFRNTVLSSQAGRCEEWLG
jgi:hypothetical protein